MAPNFSIQSHSALFGIGCDVITHAQMVQAADCFFDVRKAVEKKKAEFATLTPRQFKNRQALFRKRVEDVIAGDKSNKYYQLLMPLITNDQTIDGLKRFILACTTLSIAHTENLAERKLMSIFPQLFERVVDTVAILPETIRAAVDVIRSVCEKIDNSSSQNFQGIFDKVYGTSAESNDLSPERQAKRPCLCETSTESNDLSLERQAKRPCLSEPETELLTFDPELLKAAENGALNLDESPNLSSRRTLVHFVRSEASRLAGVFGNAPFFLGLKTSCQWRWERAQDERSLQPDSKGQTSCVIAMVPDSDEQDFSFVFRVGNQTGWAIVKFLQYDLSSEPVEA